MTESDRTVLITGANRGLGLELVRQYSARGSQVIATARNPDQADALQDLARGNAKISVEQLDVADNGSIDALKRKLGNVPIDILLNNAGVIGEPEKEVFGSIPYDHFDVVMNTNVKGPLRMSEAFVGNVASSTERKIVVVSSIEGSIGSARVCTRPFYRASKAALNMIMRNLTIGLRDKGILIGIVNPGGTETEMTAFLKSRKLRDPVVAVTDMIRLIDLLTPERSGISYNYDGNVIPW